MSDVTLVIGCDHYHFEGGLWPPSFLIELLVGCCVQCPTLIFNRTPCWVLRSMSDVALVIGCRPGPWGIWGGASPHLVVSHPLWGTPGHQKVIRGTLYKRAWRGGGFIQGPRRPEKPKAVFKMTVDASEDKSNIRHRTQHATRSVIKN